MSKAEEYNSAIMDEILASITPDEEYKTSRKMLLAARIDDGIKAKGWKKKDLALALNKRRSEITKWLSGTHNFNIDTLFDIERVLNIELVGLNETYDEQVTIFRVAGAGSQAFYANISPGESILNDKSLPDSYRVNKPPDQKNRFQIKGIELLDVKLNCPNQPLPAQMIFHYNIGLEHKINAENKIVIVIATVDVLHEDNEARLASLRASCIFEFTNFEDFLIEGSQQVSIPDTILVTLSSVSISTIRGIMYSQFKGNFLHNAILPNADPKALIKNNCE